MEDGKGYQTKDGKQVDEVILYSGGITVKISGISGSGFEKFEEVQLLCKISNGDYGLRCSYVGE